MAIIFKKTQHSGRCELFRCSANRCTCLAVPVIRYDAIFKVLQVQTPSRKRWLRPWYVTRLNLFFRSSWRFFRSPTCNLRVLTRCADSCTWRFSSLNIHLQLSNGLARNQIVLWGIEQCSPTTAPRAACGPPQHCQRPAEAFKQNLQIWNLLKSVWGCIYLTELFALYKVHLYKNNEIISFLCTILFYLFILRSD